MNKIIEGITYIQVSNEQLETLKLLYPGDINKLNAPDGTLNEALNLVQVELTKTQIQSIESGNFNLVFTTQDLTNIECEPNPETLRFNNDDIILSCEPEPPLEEPVIPQFEFDPNILQSGDTECIENIQVIVNEITEKSETRLELIEELGDLEDAYYHYRVAFEWLVLLIQYLDNPSTIPANTSTEGSRGIAFKNGRDKVQKEDLADTINTFSNMVRIQTNDGELLFDYTQFEGPSSGAIYEFYATQDDLVRNSEERFEKEGLTADQFMAEIDQLKQQLLINPFNEIIELSTNIAAREAKQFVNNTIRNPDARKGVINQITALYEPELNEYNRLVQRYDELNTEIEIISNEIDQAIEDIKNQPCVPVDSLFDEDAGQNINAWELPDLETPNPFTFKYWLKFSALASIVNLVPLYWPVGLLLPGPNGVIKVPLPIIWIPIIPFNTPVGLFVFFIGQCGIVPSPFLFVLNAGTLPIGNVQPKESKFQITLRGPKSIKLDTGSNVNMSLSRHANINGIETPAAIDPRDYIGQGLQNIQADNKVIPLGTIIPIKDDLPPWERLNLTNILFLDYLRKFCRAGKAGGGFFENP